MKTQVNPKGITLIALIITVIVMLILAGVAISLMVGDNGIFKKSKEGAAIYSEQAAKERLELALGDFVLEQYTQNKTLDDTLASQGMIVIEDIVIVDDWQFEIDRSVPKIVANIGKGSKSDTIKIIPNIVPSEDYLKVTLQIQVETEGDLSSVTLNKVSQTIPEKTELGYVIEKEIVENGKYTIIVKDTEGNYNIETIKISDIIGDMEIWDKEDMEILREKVNAGRVVENNIIRVMDEIDLAGSAESPWLTIGDATHPFLGTLEGNYHTISNLYMEVTTNSQGLFSYNNGTIQNINIEGYVRSTNTHVGLLVGRNRGTIKNVTTRGELFGGNYTGGIAGISEVNSRIEDCTNEANINEAEAKGQYVAGIVGHANGSTIENCLNTANVSGSITVAGITGQSGTINNCANTGVITAQRGFAGGICGFGGTATGCFNIGKISRKAVMMVQAFQVLGELDGAGVHAFYCYNRGEVYGSKGQVGGITGNIYNNGANVITNCYNTGPVSGGSKVGSIAGECKNSSFTSCWWTTPNAGNGYRGSYSNSAKVTEEDLKGYMTKLGEDYFKQDETGINDGFPILKWQEEKIDQ